MVRRRCAPTEHGGRSLYATESGIGQLLLPMLCIVLFITWVWLLTPTAFWVAHHVITSWSASAHVTSKEYA